MEKLTKKAKRILQKYPKYTFEDLQVAKDAHHKFKIIFYDSKNIYHISFGHTDYQDYTQHKDPERRKRYLARATKMVDSKGNLTANNPLSANFWSIHLLW